jgi:hypothetical protein
MSISHSYFETQATPVPAPTLALSRLTTALRIAATDVLSPIVAHFERRRLARAISRFPDHLLADVGFERDWDGVITATAERQD